MQTTYGYQKSRIAVAGQLEVTDSQTIETCTIPAGGLAFGSLVDLDTAATDDDGFTNTVKAHVALAMPFGVLVYDASKPPNPITGGGGYLATESGNVLRKGKIWMLGTGVAGSAHAQIPGSLIRQVSTDDDGNSIVLVEINLPMFST